MVAGLARRRSTPSPTAAHRRLPRRAQPARPAGRRLHGRAWSPACRRPRRPWRRRSARAATAPGCSCRSCATSAWRPGSCRATWCSSTADQAPLDGPAGPHGRLHRPPRVGRGLRARRRLDRPRPHLRAVRRRGPHPPRLHAGAVGRGADHRRHRAVRGHLRVRQQRDPPPRGPPASPCPTPTTSGRAIDALGDAVDRRLVAGDVRLTMGGEPTFVSVDDMEGGGVDHRRRRRRQAGAGRGARPPALAERFAPGGAAAPRAGQVVPGRAAAPLADRRAVAGRRRAAVDRPRRCWPTPTAARRRRRRADAEALGARPIAAGLGLAPSRLLAGLRGPAAPRCWREARLPGGDPPAVDVDPPTSPRRRDARLASVAALEHATGDARRLGAPAAPRRRAPPARWATSRWTLRRGRLVLVPGDSPARPAPAARRRSPGAAAPEPEPPFERSPPPSAPPSPSPDRGAEARGRAAVRRRPGGRPPPPCASRPATATSACSCRRSSTSSTPSTCSASSRRGRRARPARRARGLPPPARPPPRAARRHPRPRRHRGQRPPGVARGRSWSTSSPTLYDRGPASRLGTETFHLDGTPRRHRRRQPPHPRRADPGRQPPAAPPRPAAQPHHLLAAPPVAVVPVLGPVHRPDEPGAPRRRGPPREPLRARDRLRRARPARRRRRRRRGWSTGCSATCSSTSPATPTGPSSASTSSSAPTPSGAGSACSSCAPSRCRPTPAWRSCRRCWCGPCVARFWDEPYPRPLVRWGTELHDRFLLP